MLKKFFRLFLVVLMTFLAIGVFASGGQEKKAAGKIELQMWRGSREQVWTDYFIAVCERFNAKHPNINVVTVETGGNDLDTKLNTAFAAGSAPDMISTGIYNIAHRAGSGQFAPIDEYFNKWSAKDDLLESVIELGKYKGKQYGVGFFPDPKLFFYRKDYFQAAGLDPNKTPTTWEELADYAVKLVKKEGGEVKVAGFDINPQDFYVITALIYQNGGLLADEMADMPVWDSPAAIEALQFLTDFNKKGVAFPITAGGKGNIFRNPYYTDQAAMAFATMYGVQGIVRDKPELKNKMVVAPPLKRKQQATFSGLNFNFISTSTTHKEECWEFIAFFMTKEETWDRYKLTTVPVVFKSMKDDYMKADPENQTIFDSILVARGLPKVVWSGRNLDFLKQATEEALYGVKTPAQAAKDNVAALKKELGK